MAGVAVLEVLLHDEPVGTLTRSDDDRIFFSLKRAYIADENRNLLSLGLRNQFGELNADVAPTWTRLMPFFSNLLPEGHLRLYLAARAGIKPEREFFLLLALGRDLPGAVRIRPAHGDEPPPDAGDGHDDRHDGDRPFRYSLAGVQLKFSAIADVSGGLTIPARGIGGSWIVKLPSPAFGGVPENEYSMLTMARLLGIDVPPFRLVDVRGIGNLPDDIGAPNGQALAVRRFDRPADGTPVPFEDFAQVFGAYPGMKYHGGSGRRIAAVLGRECSDADVAEFIRRLTFSALIGNADMHLKNWGLTYPDRRHAALAPAYDFVSTIAYIRDPGAALKFSRTRRFDGYSEDELAHLAARAALPLRPVLDAARETAELFRERWPTEKKNLPLAANAVEAIDTHLVTVPIAN